MTSNLPVGITLSTAWDSHYVSEGLDNLDGDRLMGATLEFSLDGFILGTWYANSPNGSYDELNAYLEYGFELGDFELYLGYNHLRSMSQNAHDNEIAAGVAYNGFSSGIVPAADWYYSFEAEGSFVELSLVREFEVAPWLTLTPGVVFGNNDGYIADGHNGANHLAATLSATIPLSDNVELGAYVSYNWAIDSDMAAHADDDALEDFVYGGVAMTLSF